MKPWSSSRAKVMVMSNSSSPIKRVTTLDLVSKTKQNPIVGLAAYTAPMAELSDQEVDFLLVGDSLAMTVYGEPSTLGVGLDTMIRHGRAVVQATKHACVVVDLPFGSYQASPEQAFISACRVMKETGCNAVKLEGGTVMAETVHYLVARGIPVMGHVGLTPQSTHVLGGMKTQGRDTVSAQALIDDARAIDQAGCFAMVIEGVIEQVTNDIIEAVQCVTIGIGASSQCDGQILVVDDVVGLFSAFKPKFVKHYAEIRPTIARAIGEYAADVRQGKFPQQDHVFKS